LWTCCGPGSSADAERHAMSSNMSARCCGEGSQIWVPWAHSAADQAAKWVPGAARCGVQCAAAMPVLDDNAGARGDRLRGQQRAGLWEQLCAVGWAAVCSGTLCVTAQ
jgi:hypothetical protein